MAENEEDARSTVEIIEEEVEKFLDLKITYCGFVPYEPALKESVRFFQNPRSSDSEEFLSSFFRNIADGLTSNKPEFKSKKSQQFFAKRILKEEHDETLTGTNEG
jgi:MinD-like ATPase involved in chromosome partitioning or flagellar assembly